MGVIPAFLLRHTIIIEPYDGHTATGPKYGPPITVKSFNEDKRRVIKDRNGNKVVSSATSRCLPGTVAPVQSRVTINGRVTTVLQHLNHDGGGLPTPDHVELLLE